MEQFLKELEAQLARSTPAARAELGAAVRSIAGGIAKMSPHLRLSRTAALGLLGALMKSMFSKTGPAGLLQTTKKASVKAGPHVAAVFQAL